MKKLFQQIRDCLDGRAMVAKAEGLRRIEQEQYFRHCHQTIDWGRGAMTRIALSAGIFKH